MVSGSSLCNSRTALMFLAPWLTGNSFLLTLASAVLFIGGLLLTLRRQTRWETGVERMIPFGRTFFAVPLALFGMQHFAFLNEVQGFVPAWMPWHVFWASLVGVALIAACLSILTDIQAGLPASLVGIMLFLFVLMLHIPGFMMDPHNRFAITGPLRDVALAGGGFALAGTVGILSRKGPIPWLVHLGRWCFGVPLLYFGVEQFLHPHFAPGVPYETLMPSWIPAQLVWSFGTGAVLLVCGACILTNRGARVASAWLGVAYLALVIFIYMPMEIVHPSIEISAALDNVVDILAMSGGALLVAASLGSKSERTASFLQA